MTPQPRPQQSDELKAVVNGWLVEVAFGVYDREDLPKLADKLLKELSAHYAAEIGADMSKIATDLHKLAAKNAAITRKDIHDFANGIAAYEQNMKKRNLI